MPGARDVVLVRGEPAFFRLEGERIDPDLAQGSKKG
jgi:hypothetical protein